LVQRGARIISITRPSGNEGIYDPDYRMHTIWFEAEGAQDEEWCAAVFKLANELREKDDATVPKSG
jgi:hypothetical protein